MWIQTPCGVTFSAPGTKLVVVVVLRSTQLTLPVGLRHRGERSDFAKSFALPLVYLSIAEADQYIGNVISAANMVVIFLT
jgi:hypothetical protein